jgi:DNA-directed RNA polymerase subunit N (RpoN/RPB10)
MCHPVRCKTCGKTTWSGCGRHTAQVKAAVPAGQWCAGHKDPSHDRDSLLGRLFRRGS